MPDVVFFDFIYPELIAAGFLGGLVHAFRIDKATPWEIVKFIVVGGIAANFLAPQVLKILPWLPPGFIAFGTGMNGKHLCYVMELFFAKLDILGKTKNE
jgi:hypothetical protein